MNFKYRATRINILVGETQQLFEKGKIIATLLSVCSKFFMSTSTAFFTHKETLWIFFDLRAHIRIFQTSFRICINFYPILTLTYLGNRMSMYLLLLATVPTLILWLLPSVAVDEVRLIWGGGGGCCETEEARLEEGWRFLDRAAAATLTMLLGPDEPRLAVLAVAANDEDGWRVGGTAGVAACGVPPSSRASDSASTLQCRWAAAVILLKNKLLLQALFL